MQNGWFWVAMWLIICGSLDEQAYDQPTQRTTQEHRTWLLLSMTRQPKTKVACANKHTVRFFKQPDHLVCGGLPALHARL